MFLIAFLGLLAVTSGLPAQQILAPAIPAANHILILTPQAQVQLEPTVKYSQPLVQPLVQHLAPVARIGSEVDQTVVYVPNENLRNAASKSAQQAKQIETTNITQILNQFINAGQTAQTELQALQGQLSQSLENIIQGPGEEKLDGSSGEPKPIIAAEPSRQEGGRFYSVPTIPRFYTNYEVIHAPLNPVFTIQPYQTIRARNVVLPEEKIYVNAPQSLSELNAAKIIDGSENKILQQKVQEVVNQARNVESVEQPAIQPQPEIFEDKSLHVPKESEPVPVNSQFGKLLGTLEKKEGDAPEALLEKKEAQMIAPKKEGSELLSVAEALPAGLAISGEGGLSLAKPIGSAIVGNDGIAYSAPKGTAISGSDNEQSLKSS